MKKKNAAAETTHTAAENAAALLNEAKDKLGPLLDQSKDRITPLLDQSKERLAPFANEARARGTEYAHQAAVAVAPALAAAKGAARERYDDMLPKVTEALENLANNPNAQEAQFRGVAAIKALRGDLQLSKKDRKRLHQESLAQIQSLKDTATPKRKKKGKFLPLLLLGALGGLAFVAWKKFFGAQETDWQTHTASAYQSSTGQPTPATSVTEPAASSPAAAAAADTTATAPKYGEGAYVGAEPPEGYTIKGNERSKKYHTPETGGYERTIADVWFQSEEAAEAAGFAKAQR
ncbi:DUF5324 family protein [Granulicoccus sp. GXG6511]|uniref:sunset domain-containing protein n=1 Tax=Granulicoccus sp. GXG6511 TaxID=3381351 RepID=UPI003D7DD105